MRHGTFATAVIAGGKTSVSKGHGVNWKLATGLAMIIATAFPSEALAANWLRITSSQSGTVVFVDAASIRIFPAISIRRPFEVRQIWIKYDYTKDKTESARENKTLQSFDCASRTSAALSMTLYAENGSVINSRTRDDYDFVYEPVVPDSVGETLLGLVCNPERLDDYAAAAAADRIADEMSGSR